MVTETATDQQLVASYAREASETAFQAVVARHVDLVYATALRQLGDPGLSEEVAQNVFIILARKAPRLGGIETLAGWLHRTTILESKARLRTELRRRQREHHAAELAALQHEGTSALAPLLPLVDEALLHLRENDRLALILRFLEERSLREVGAVLGVDEDAARKRVARALERLGSFFRERGFAIPTGSGAAALLTHSLSAAPAGLAATAAQAGLTAGGTLGGIHWILFHLMALTKTQTALVCAFVAATPLFWQRQTEAGLQRETSAIAARLAATRSQASDIDSEIARVREALIRTQADSVNAENRLAYLQAIREGQAPSPIYRWDDKNWLLRVPKELLGKLSISATADKLGRLSEQIKELLQLTEDEIGKTQTAIDRFLTDYRAAQAKQMQLVPPAANELQGWASEDVRVFEMVAPTDQLGPLRERLFQDLESTLGPDRFQLFRRALNEWMPITDEDRGMGSGMAVFNFDRREMFRRPKPGEAFLGWGVTKPNGELFRATMSLEEIPSIYQDALQDWINLAKSQPSQP